MENLERLGAFYLGKEYDLEAGGFWGGHMGHRWSMGPRMGPRKGMMGPGRRPYGDGDPRDWGRRW